MGSAGRDCVILDTSVLINFLAIDQAHLLVDHPKFEFIMTDHVQVEVTEHYFDEFTRLEAMLATPGVKQISVNTPEELEIFGELTLIRRLGSGECAAIAAAIHRGCGIAIDDQAAIKHLSRLYPALRVETTQSLMVGLIKLGVLTITEADGFKERWQVEHRFRLSFHSFRDVL